MIKLSLWKKFMKTKLLGIIFLGIFLLLLTIFPSSPAGAQPDDFTKGLTLPKVEVEFEKQKEPLSKSLQLIMYLTFLTLAPYIIVCTTSFIRITVIFSFLKTSLGATHAPSTQIWMGLAITLTLFIMAPVGARMEKEAITPYKNGEINYNVFNRRMQQPLIDFMKANTRTKDLKLFILLSKTKKRDKYLKNPPMHIMIPAFICSELRAGFFVGFVFYLPFLCIDMITAAVLMSMGMFMLSPMSISMPMKVLTFCVIDGLDLVVEGLVKSYRY